jgi:hypothetical protein
MLGMLLLDARRTVANLICASNAQHREIGNQPVTLACHCHYLPLDVMRMRWFSVHMKTRVTLTLEPSVSHHAKQAARSRGISLSQLVGTLLEREIGDAASSKSSMPFAERWAGRLQIAERSEPRFERLASKYDL